MQERRGRMTQEGRNQNEDHSFPTPFSLISFILSFISREGEWFVGRKSEDNERENSKSKRGREKVFWFYI